MLKNLKKHALRTFAPVLALTALGCSANQGLNSPAASSGIGPRLTVGQGDYRVPEGPGDATSPYALTGDPAPSDRTDSWTGQSHSRLTVGQAEIFVPAQR